MAMPPPILTAKSDIYANDSGEISITASSVFSSCLYRFDVFGKYNECGVGLFETVNSKSIFSSAFFDVAVVVEVRPEYGDVGDTTSSCHVVLGRCGAVLWLYGTRGCYDSRRGGYGGPWDGLKHVDRQGIKELVSKYEGSGLLFWAYC